ncbi:hypothetical protein ACM55F_11640 [Flavobacterium sp. XS2P12]|uniref:hypothetical protein n=1 Tax=Flavobacterium melibiosi TaxID=3398734 RepID=UPI003A8C1F14
MKNCLRKLVLFTTFLLLIVSCSKDENSSDVPSETIKIEDDLKINFADLTVVTIDGEAKVDARGNFSANTTNTVAKNLPLLFIKDNEIMFGYYSKTGLNNSISTTDLLLFYFTLHPEIALQGFQNSELLDKIKQNSNYDELTSLIKASLDANLSPFKNASFVSLLNKTGFTIGVAKRQAKLSKISKSQSFDFRYTYSRDGTIVWNNKFPLFATVGMEVVDVSTGVSVSGPKMFDNRGLVLSPGSGLEWLWDRYVGVKFEKSGTFKLPKEGKYEIRFTNGVDNFGTKVLEQEVDFNNRFNIGISVLSIAFPIGITEILEDNKCRDATVDLIKNMRLSTTTLVITDKSAMAEFIINLYNDLFFVATDCLESKPKKNFAQHINFIAKKLNAANELGTLYLLLKDYLFSDIKGKETRYFYDGVSFGELQLTNTTGLQYITPTGTEFSGQAKSEHPYTASVNETAFKYSINRDNILTTSITSDTSKEYAIGLPFEVNKTNSGDATLKGNKIIPTSIEGQLAATFVMGTQESKFEIKPAFKNSGLSSEFVNLKEMVDLTSFYNEKVVGSWKVENKDYPGTYSVAELYAGGTGKYISQNGVLFTNGGYAITWRITKKDNKYYLFEDGFNHPGFNQFRKIGTNLPNESLTYPLTFFKTYGDLGDGKGTVEALLYTKL